LNEIVSAHTNKIYNKKKWSLIFQNISILEKIYVWYCYFRVNNNFNDYLVKIYLSLEFKKIKFKLFTLKYSFYKIFIII